MSRIQKAKKKIRKPRRRPRRQGHVWLSLDVRAIAFEKAFREAVSRHAFADVGWPRAPLPGRKKFDRTHDARDLYRKVRACIEIDAYLTRDVPEKLRKRTYTVRTPGEAMARAAQMYRKVYEENARLGGEPVRADVDKRVARRRRQNGSFLRNRGFEPYVWGHDIDDLVFETLHVEWHDSKQTQCNITFGIGS